MSRDTRQDEGIFWRTIDRASLFIANVALVVILLVICWTVVSRYLLRSPVSWGEDVTSIAFAWFIFMAMVAVHNRRGHIGIDLFTALMPPKVQTLLNRAADLFIACFCLYTAYLCGWQMIISHHTAYTTVLKIPLSYLFLSLALGFFLLAVRSIGFALTARAAAGSS